MKVNEPVQFDPEDPEKYAVIFFTLAATDSEAHLKTWDVYAKYFLMKNCLVN